MSPLEGKAAKCVLIKVSRTFLLHTRVQQRCLKVGGVRTSCQVFAVRQWRLVDHHEAHARMGFYSSPFTSAMVVSYDGGGNDGVAGHGSFLPSVGTCCGARLLLSRFPLSLLSLLICNSLAVKFFAS